MTSKPRKTSEFELQSGSVRKSANNLTSSSRASKIAVRRPSFNDRQSNAAQSSRPTLNRNTIGTPLRTPLRSNSSDRNVIPMTAEKEKPPLEDRQWLQSKVARIVDELGSIEGLSAEFVQKRNLKSMSTKQFIAILMHFLKPIVGRVQLDTSNYVDYIHDLLPKIEYPFTINKSWLKTPNAPHCQNHIIVLLGWLSDFTLPPHEAAIETEVDQEFFSAELSSMFQKQAAEAFKLWNSNMESEYNHIQDSISRTYLNEKAGIANLGEEIEKATAEYAQLKKERAPVNTKIEYDNVLKDSQQLDQIIRKKTESNNELMKTKEKAIVELNQRMSAVHKTNGEIQELQDQIARQTLSVDRKIELLQDLNNLRDLLGVKERTVTELQENSSQNDIQLSRLLKKKFTLVESLNNQIYKLHSDINLAGMASNFCGGKFVPSLCEVKCDNHTNINNHLTKLQKLSEQLDVEIKGAHEWFKSECVPLEKQKNELLGEQKSLASKIDNVEETLKRKHEELKKLADDNGKFPAAIEREIKMKNEEFVKLDQEAILLRKRIRALAETIKKKEQDNKTFTDTAHQKCLEALRIKEENHRAVTSIFNLLDSVFAELEIDSGEDKK